MAGPESATHSLDLRRSLAERRAAITSGLGDLAAGSLDGQAIARAHADILDELIAALVERACEASGQTLEGIEVAAVGSYGRGAVALGSDLDIRILSRNHRAAERFADALLYPLWDSGMAVGHQVVSPDALLAGARTDLPSATSLLDWRHLAGDEALGVELRRRANEGVFSDSELGTFVARLEDEVARRHARFGASVYLLEPDVKNGAGGLRDLDVARWAALARFGLGEPDELVRIGALLPREAVDLQTATELLWQIRMLLHARAGRRSDRLTFDEQENLAALLGYGDGDEGVEHLMSAYYRTARAVSRLLEMVLARAAPVLSRRRPRYEDLGGGVQLFDGVVTMSDANAFEADPALALRLVVRAVERNTPLLPHARDAIARVASDPAWSARLRESPDASRMFVELVASCRETSLKAGSAVRELHDLGLLLAMIPEFSPVVGRVHHDTYHVYTVDVHSVAAVDRLATLVRGERAADHPLACRLAAEIARPQMLFLATLLHDVGKAIGGGDHSVRGAEMTEAILARLGFPAADVEQASYLVRKHLVMYHVATRRDLEDPATADEFSREVRGAEGLRELFLLTVADLSTTSPTSMTSWKARMLDELYEATDALLDGGASAAARASADKRSATRTAEVERAAREAGLEGAFVRGFLTSMPERYLLANAPAAIVAHAEVARRHADQHLDIELALVPSRHSAAAEICVVATDRPGLLAAITAAFAASRLEVHAAEIHSRAAGADALQAVDLFWVRDRGEGVEGVARALPKLRRDVRAVLGGDVDATELAARRGTSTWTDRPSPRVPARVSIDDRASRRHTVIEVVARDRPGLLFAVAVALHRLGLSIAVAKINTEGTRVADVFYVNEADGSKVAHGRRSQQVQDTLQAALDRLEEGSIR